MIYLDHNATTPVHPEVRESMMPYLGEEFGNPSSSHALGLRAMSAVEEARSRVAGLLGCNSEELYFTSGGSESDNLALKGTVESYMEKGNHIITSSIEHPAIVNTVRFLERKGCPVAFVPVDNTGLVDPTSVRKAIRSNTILVSIMHANNEVGTIEPVAEIGKIARESRVVFHTDAAQSVGKIPTSVDDLGVDMLTVAGHKLYAPKGVGALFVRKGVRLEPLIHGAAHERGLRAGTENVASIVGLGTACAIAWRDMERERERVTELRDMLFRGLQDRVGGVRLNGHPQLRLPNTLNISFEGVEGHKLLGRLPQIAASTGAACHDSTKEVSPVLSAMGIPYEAAVSAIRLSMGRLNSEQDITMAVELISDAVSELRGT